MRFLCLPAALCILFSLAAWSGQAPQQAHAGNYYLWACGYYEQENDGGVSRWYSTRNNLWSPQSNVNTTSQLATASICPSRIISGQVQRSGMYSYTETDTECNDSTNKANSRCFPSWTPGAWSRWQFLAPSGTYIEELELYMGARSVIPSGVSGLTRPQWRPSISIGTASPFSSPQGVITQMTGDAGAYYSNQAGSLVETATNCSGSRPTSVACIWQMSRYSPMNSYSAGSFGFSNPTSFNVDLRCDPNHSISAYATRCPIIPNPGITDGDYAGRLNLRATRIKLQDPQAPSVSLSSGMSGLASDQVVNGSQSAGTVSSDDNIGSYVQNLEMLRTNAADQDLGVAWSAGAVTRTECNANKVDNYSGVGQASWTWVTKQPCPSTSWANSFGTVNTAAFSDGFYRMRGTAIDIPANSNTAQSARFIIDNNSQTECSSGNAITSVDDVLAPDGKRWMSGNRTITARVCDPWSGVGRAEIQAQVNGGSWTAFCSNTINSSRESNTSTSCSYNTNGPAEGSTVAFRVAVYDRAGNSPVYSPASSVRYIDNEVPQVGAVGFDAASSDAYRTWNNEPSPAGWTNAEKLTIEWPQVSPGSGSPITAVKVAYRSAPTAACSFDSYTLSATATSQQVSVPTTGCSEENAQGTHTSYVWATDLAGNEASNPTSGSVSSKVGTGTFKYDSIAPSFGALTVTPGNWSRTNAFQASFTAPTIAAATQSPLMQVEYQVGEGQVKSTTSCQQGNVADRAGQLCTIGSTDLSQSPITVPEGGGQFQLRAWLRDQAGNANRQSGGIDTIKYDDQVCIR